MAQILAVGVATLDIINEVAAYPEEDSELRALSQRVQRGGNATNTLVVLSQLGHSCVWGGVLADGPGAAVVLEELQRYRIGTAYCRRVPQGAMPTSTVTLSRASGSRTIVHFRDLPEYDLEHFSRIPLQGLQWLHFEGRDVNATRGMMQQAREQAPGLPISLEVEKPREHIEQLFPLADLLLSSSAFAACRRLAPDNLLLWFRELAPRADLVCSLGEQGAIGLGRDGVAMKANACSPEQVVDTLGAGDTFNAGVIHTLLGGALLQDALRFACALAGGKCGQRGLHKLSIPPRSGS
jgi:ketohexokinase